MKRSGVAIALCMAILHSPGSGGELRVDVNQITVVRPIEAEQKQHVAHGSQSILFAGGQKFAVQETLDQVQDAIHHCIDGDR